MGKNLLNSIQVKRPNRNFFDLSHDVKLSMNMGELIPVYLEDCVPGDKFKINANALVRFAPLVAPMMHMVNVYIHYFFVPKRILWANWENYITNTLVSGSLPAVPYVEINGANYDRLADYMGIPKPNLAGNIGSENVCGLPFAAYNKIFNEYYRDQNLVTELPDLMIDGNNTSANYTAVRNRAWAHDYFTSCLPFAQKGNVVTMPIQADVVLKTVAQTTNPGQVRNAGSHGLIQGALTSDAAGNFESNATDSVYDPNGTLEIAATNTAINDFRRALKLQEFLERDARGGTRYNEKIYAHFGVKSSDARLQRPEYITGVMSPVQVSEVLNTTGTSGQLPQGNMAGHAISAASGVGGGYFCEEHGYIMGIMSVMPKTCYQQGIPKHFLKTGDWSEHYWTEFAHIGEQPVLNKEIYAFQGSTGTNTFGYIPRYAEYKFASSRVCGDFRSTLNHWTMARIFSSAPALNTAFVTSDPTHRVFAVTDPAQQKLYCHVFNDIKATRLMPKYGTPML